MLSLWDVASLTMIAFWPHLTVDDFLLLSSSNIQTPGMSKYVHCLTHSHEICYQLNAYWWALEKFLPKLSGGHQGT